MENLLNALLGDEYPINSVILNETQLTPDLLAGKGCRLDLLATIQSGEKIAIEVQVANHGNMISRSLFFYWSKLYCSQLFKGEDYGEARKVIAINILDFSLLDTPDFYSSGQIFARKRKKLITDLLDLRFLELAKLPDFTLDLNEPLNRWFLFLNHRTKSALKEEILMADPQIREAKEDLEKLSLDPQALRLYELREKYILDERNARRFHFEQGEAQGRIQGRVEGRAEGKAEGKAEGRKQEKVAIAQQMLKEGLEESVICRITGLSLEKLAKLRS